LTCNVLTRQPDGRNKWVPIADVAESGDYNDLLNKPVGGEGGPHTHSLSDVTGLQTALDGKQAAGSYADEVHNHDGAYDAAGAADAALASALAADFSGDYADLTNKPTLGTAAAKNVGTGANDVSAGDHTHAGGSDPWTIVALANDFTTTSSTAQNVGLGFTPAANGRYMFEAVLGVRTATATVNPRVGLAWPTGMTDGVAQIDESQTATARLMSNGNISAALLVAVGGIPNTTQSWPVTVWGWVKAGATPSGDVRIQLASETNGTTVRVTAHSYLRYRTY
jgi:hypothetical protein